MSATLTLLDQLLAPVEERDERAASERDEAAALARDERAAAVPGAAAARERGGAALLNRDDVHVGGPEARHDGGEPTLDAVLADAWAGLVAHRVVTCPVCAGALAPRYGSGHAALGGRCRDCGSELG